MAVLFIEGIRGASPRHWQRWLARELDARGDLYSFPDMPEWDLHVETWLALLRTSLRHMRSDGPIVVLAHSCGASLWLHHAATWTDDLPRAERVLLVAPPGPNWVEPAGAGFVPTPLNREGVAAAAASTRLVAGTGDFFIRESEARSYAAALGIDIDVIPEGGHLTVEDGFGAWPAARDWVLEGTVPLRGW